MTTTNTTEAATITIYADHHVWGLAYGTHVADPYGGDTGPIGPSLDHVDHEDRVDSDLRPAADAAVAALEAAGLLVDLDDSMLAPSTANDALAIVTVSDRRAAVRILESL